ncbi:MAG: alpha-amylase family glycosyl hydrolase [Pseudomonadota bacterium]
MTLVRRIALAALTSAPLLAGCDSGGLPERDYYGTLEPFASEAVYFVVTDRFVDGDPGNNQTDQGGPDRGTFDRPITNQDGQVGNIGYQGGDFRGIADNGDYIAAMGFTALWLTPIVNNPDEAFTGGLKLGEGIFADNGKTGYHGYWGVNFFELDEHLPSPGLDFAALTATLRDDHGLKTVLDIVCNHGSPSYTMPEDQPLFGELYDSKGTLVADHQNRHPSELDPANPLHAWFNRKPDLAELSDFDGESEAVLDYFVAAYLKWIDDGAAAFRVDTIRHLPHSYWKAFSDRIREVHPGFFMFGESFDYDAAKIATHTYPENGGVSVLDFPGRKALTDLLENPGTDFATLIEPLHLEDGVYQNPYELMSFYDNHDMPRMNADDNGFIDAHNWLFTARGIPVIYYGSEVAFRAGRPEHGGNRDYFGQERVDAAPDHPVHEALTRIANIRRASPALQRGLQANLNVSGDTATFFRVYQKDGVNQTALVMLNKGDKPAAFAVDTWLSSGDWRDAASGQKITVSEPGPRIGTTVGAHGVRVLLLDAPNSSPELAEELDRLQAAAVRSDRG